MKSDIFNFLRSYSTEPKDIDRLIVSSFLRINNYNLVINSLINSYIILENEVDNVSLKYFSELILNDESKFDFENLIELFEFVISPADKVVNGAVYTPKYIREYIINRSIEKSSINIGDLKCCDLACGCGGFLLNLSKIIKLQTSKSYYEIFSENIYGLDITDYSINRAKLLLTLFAISEGEDCQEFIFNIRQGNSLDYNWKDEFEELEDNDGFDIIIGNPPYVTSRNMDDETLSLLKNWEVSSTGHPDLYIPFFQLGIENLNTTGILGFITVNTFFKSVNGRALRSYFARNSFDLKIIDFGGEQVFKSRSTYTCICFITKSENGCINYLKSSSKELGVINDNMYSRIFYNEVNNLDGWHLNTLSVVSNIKKIENTGRPLGEIYIYRTGIATLRNNIYKFTPVNVRGNHYELIQDGVSYLIERDICREIINSNKVKNNEELQTLREMIIFPYNMIDGKAKVINEEEFRINNPFCYQYLLANKSELAKRDKGNRKYEEWFAYGRNQSLEIGENFKLFFPHLCSSVYSVICDDRNLLFYNGEAILSNNLNELLVLKAIMESDIFWYYIVNSSKPYSSNFYSLGKNYIKNFGIPELNEEEEDFLINELDKSKINKFLQKKYNIKLEKEN